MGIANLIVMALMKQNMPENEALKLIWLVDSKGLVVKVSLPGRNYKVPL